MIKYLGSKRRLVPVLGELLERAGARTALDLFSGTTRVAQEFKRRGAEVIAVDSTRYAHALAGCYVATDAEAVDAFKTLARLEGILPALESSHAVAYAQSLGRELGPSSVILVNLSGRGDKDVHTMEQHVETR